MKSIEKFNLLKHFHLSSLVTCSKIILNVLLASGHLPRARSALLVILLLISCDVLSRVQTVFQKQAAK